MSKRFRPRECYTAARIDIVNAAVKRGKQEYTTIEMPLHNKKSQIQIGYKPCKKTSKAYLQCCVIGQQEV